MTFKKLFIIVFVIVAAFYVFKVKGFNPFVSKIKGDIALTLVDGKATTLEECAGENGTFIFDMGTWCPHCSGEVDRLKNLNEFFKTHKINILIGMEGESNDDIRSWVYKHDFPWNWKTFYWYGTHDKEFDVKVNGVPYLIIRNKKGEKIFNKAGVYPTDYLSKLALDMLKDNK